jgi:caffeoyl-CoA O-methyltransferase
MACILYNVAYTYLTVIQFYRKETMFHNIPDPMLARMRALEAIDARDRTDGTTRLERLRQVPPETGKFLALMAASAPEGKFIEIGTSAGYSTLWLSLACRLRGCRVTTFEILEEKVRLAKETFQLAQVNNQIELVHGNAIDYLVGYAQIAFCFLDAEKEVYAACYEKVIPKLVPGGLLLADNAINHQAILQPVLDRAVSDPRIDALVVPIGKGVLVCRKVEPS